MRIFVTGATGFVGSVVVADLIGAGHDVVGLVRSAEGARVLALAGAEPVQGDLGDLEALGVLAQKADAVIHTAFNHDFSRMAESCELDRLVLEAFGTALEGSNKPLIVTAGLPLLPGQLVSEGDEPAPGRHSTPRVSEQTAMSMIERGVRAMVIRMAQVHDQTKQGFASYLLKHARKKGVSAYPGEGLNRWAAVHRLDAGRLYRLVLERGAAGERYHAVAEEGVPMREIAQAIGRKLEVPVVSLSAEASAEHFGWLNRIASMDITASSEQTQLKMPWFPKESPTLLFDLKTGDSSCPT
jgi:nucleoside-diphosphate-sugar epimerase